MQISKVSPSTARELPRDTHPGRDATRAASRRGAVSGRPKDRLSPSPSKGHETKRAGSSKSRDAEARSKAGTKEKKSDAMREAPSRTRETGSKEGGKEAEASVASVSRNDAPLAAATPLESVGALEQGASGRKEAGSPAAGSMGSVSASAAVELKSFGAPQSLVLPKIVQLQLEGGMRMQLHHRLGHEGRARLGEGGRVSAAQVDRLRERLHAGGFALATDGVDGDGVLER